MYGMNNLDNVDKEYRVEFKAENQQGVVVYSYYDVCCDCEFCARESAYEMMPVEAEYWNDENSIDSESDVVDETIKVVDVYELN